MKYCCKKMERSVKNGFVLLPTEKRGWVWKMTTDNLTIFEDISKCHHCKKELK